MFSPSQIAPVVIEFIDANPTFTIPELDRYVNRQICIAIGGAYRVLYRLKRRGTIQYTCSRGVYQAVIVKGGEA